MPDTVTKPYVRHVPDAEPFVFSAWEVYIPPTGPECYENGDEAEGAVLGPWGESFWPSWQDACDFVAQVLNPPTVTFVVPVTCLVTVTGAPTEPAVTKVTFLAGQELGADERPFVWESTGDPTDDEVANARRVLDRTCWKPLAGLPDDVVWEG